MPKEIKCDYFLASSLASSSLAPIKQFHSICIITTLPCHGLFFLSLLLEHLFRLSHGKTHWTMSVDNACLALWCLLGTSNSITTLYFLLGVNRSGPGTNPHGDYICAHIMSTFHTDRQGSSCSQQHNNNNFSMIQKVKSHMGNSIICYLQPRLFIYTISSIVSHGQRIPPTMYTSLSQWLVMKGYLKPASSDRPYNMSQSCVEL
jgi:hypothetical protein